MEMLAFGIAVRMRQPDRGVLKRFHREPERDSRSTIGIAPALTTVPKITQS